jgi:putative flippase GtrA
LIKRELVIWLFVGSLTVIIDFLMYRSLIGLGIDVAKGIGFLTGTFFAYIANRFWTFSYNKYASGSALRFIFLYLLTLIINVVVNSIALKVMADNLTSVQLAFIFATGVSASLNFLGMKFFVFKSRVN